MRRGRRSMARDLDGRECRSSAAANETAQALVLCSGPGRRNDPPGMSLNGRRRREIPLPGPKETVREVAECLTASLVVHCDSATMYCSPASRVHVKDASVFRSEPLVCELKYAEGSNTVRIGENPPPAKEVVPTVTIPGLDCVLKQNYIVVLTEVPAKADSDCGRNARGREQALQKQEAMKCAKSPLRTAPVCSGHKVFCRVSITDRRTSKT